jgi:hypothetical protein
MGNNLEAGGISRTVFLFQQLDDKAGPKSVVTSFNTCRLVHWGGWVINNRENSSC